MRTPRPIVLQGLLAWLAMLLLPPALSAQDAPPQNQQYAQVKLFSIPYGSEPDQLGLSSAPVETGERAGPGHIQVDGHGNIWLLDACHAQVKAFSRDGKLLRTVGKAEPGELDEYGNPVNPLARVNYIAQYAVDDRGYVYLWCDLNYMRLLVVDPSGRVVTSDVDGYGWLIEPRGEEKLRLQMTEAGLEGLLDPVPFDGFQTDRAGNLYMLVGTSLASSASTRGRTVSPMSSRPRALAQSAICTSTMPMASRRGLSTWSPPRALRRWAALTSSTARTTSTCTAIGSETSPR